MKQLLLAAPEAQLSKQCVKLVNLWKEPEPTVLQVLAVIDWAVYTGGASRSCMLVLETLLNKAVFREGTTLIELYACAPWRNVEIDIYETMLSTIKEAG